MVLSPSSFSSRNVCRMPGCLRNCSRRPGVDYAVEADEYQGGIVFKSARVGAFFYVRPEAKERAVDVMLANGYIPA